MAELTALTAKSADRHKLYEESVQNPEEEIRFIRRVYKSAYGRFPTLIREDFCGTAAVCREWVRKDQGNRAIGVDLDEEVLEWGRRHNVAPLGSAAGRVALHRRNVLDPPPDERPHVVTAMNFSYFAFKSRSVLLEYFREVHRSLHQRGMILLDIYGGPEAMVLQEEETEYEDYSYVWDQDHYDPVTADYRCYIHFRFPDGTEIPRAFQYDWRLWGLPEIQDLLREAGFSKVTVYWEGADEDGEGNGVFKAVKTGENDAAWIAYIVGIR
ncbi:MAG: class I SAM-dependent methyltransferase [Candidatus Eisenbacteria bacterium]